MASEDNVVGEDAWLGELQELIQSSFDDAGSGNANPRHAVLNSLLRRAARARVGVDLQGAVITPETLPSLEAVLTDVVNSVVSDSVLSVPSMSAPSADEPPPPIETRPFVVKEASSRSTGVVHQEARKQHPAYRAAGVKRIPVPDDQVPWAADWPDYGPARFTSEKVLKLSGSTADPEDARQIAADEWARPDRVSACGRLWFDAHGRPLNPRGRTGLEGRGDLFRWGVNTAFDPILTRIDASVVHVLAQKRADTGQVRCARIEWRLLVCSE